MEKTSRWRIRRRRRRVVSHAWLELLVVSVSGRRGSCLPARTSWCNRHVSSLALDRVAHGPEPERFKHAKDFRWNIDRMTEGGPERLYRQDHHVDHRRQFCLSYADFFQLTVDHLLADETNHPARYGHIASSETKPEFDEKVLQMNTGRMGFRGHSPCS